ncbi:MGMT family protein [Kocuria varians]|uniref:MGMT family protein n=1 Tax=Kocuria varians TaxID=1272 RepID=UPI001E2E96B1|nr:MGMT family protein [Kocuria varians]
MNETFEPLRGDEAVAAVRAVVVGIPPGAVLSYGDVAELAGLGTPRLAARIMASGKLGRGTPWWRVVRADGTLPDHLQITARERYEREGTPLRDTRAHWAQVDVRRARWAEPVQYSGGPATSKNEPRGSNARPVRRS